MKREKRGNICSIGCYIKSKQHLKEEEGKSILGEQGGSIGGTGKAPPWLLSVYPANIKQLFDTIFKQISIYTKFMKDDNILINGKHVKILQVQKRVTNIYTSTAQLRIYCVYDPILPNCNPSAINQNVQILLRSGASTAWSLLWWQMTSPVKDGSARVQDILAFGYSGRKCRHVINLLYAIVCNMPLSTN